MSRLASRIRGQHGANAAAMASFHPAGTADTPHVMPAVHVQFGPSGAAVQVLTSARAADGRQVPAAPHGRWDQVPMAGRP